jgi:hypothetical protein
MQKKNKNKFRSINRDIQFYARNNHNLYHKDIKLNRFLSTDSYLSLMLFYWYAIEKHFLFLLVKEFGERFLLAEKMKNYENTKKKRESEMK